MKFNTTACDTERSRGQPLSTKVLDHMTWLSTTALWHTTLDT